jgi:hypothetical protein
MCTLIASSPRWSRQHSGRPTARAGGRGRTAAFRLRARAPHAVLAGGMTPSDDLPPPLSTRQPGRGRRSPIKDPGSGSARGDVRAGEGERGVVGPGSAVRPARRQPGGGRRRGGRELCRLSPCAVLDAVLARKDAGAVAHTVGPGPGARRKAAAQAGRVRRGQRGAEPGWTRRRRNAADPSLQEGTASRMRNVTDVDRRHPSSSRQKTHSGACPQPRHARARPECRQTDGCRIGVPSAWQTRSASSTSDSRPWTGPPIVSSALRTRYWTVFLCTRSSWAAAV